MFEGCSVELKTRKNYLKEDSEMTTTFQCVIKHFDELNEELFLLLENAELSDVSLDAKYECQIWSANGLKICVGRIMERFMNKSGYNLRFQIEDGFYENNVN